MLQILITALVSLVIVWILGPLVIPMLARLKPEHAEQEPAPEPPPEKSRKKKEPPPKPPTPTMGGVMVLLAVAIPTLIFGLDGMEFTLPALAAMLAFGVLGFVDDFIRVRDPDGIGLRPGIMLGVEIVIAAIVAIWAYRSPLIGSQLHLPLEDMNPETAVEIAGGKNIVIVPISTPTSVIAHTLQYAKSIGDDVLAVHIATSDDIAQKVEDKWRCWNPGSPSTPRRPSRRSPDPPGRPSRARRASPCR